MKKNLILIVCSLIIFNPFLIGCATKTNFFYNYPTIEHSNTTGPTLGLKPVIDKRTSNKKIDKIFKSNPLTSIDKLIVEEMKSTGLFSDVLIIPNENTSASEIAQIGQMDFIIESQLKQLKWEVPNYESMIGKTFIISFCTGLIGGVIYGSTKTDVNGDTILDIKLINHKNGNLIIEKSYTGNHTERMAKFSCDTPSTKAKVIGKSTKVLIENFKKDLLEKFKTAP